MLAKDISESFLQIFHKNKDLSARDAFAQKHLKKDGFSLLRKRAWEKSWELGFSSRKLKNIPLQSQKKVADINLSQKPECYHLVFVDGRFHAEKSDTIEGITALSVEDAFSTYGMFLHDRMGKAIDSAKTGLSCLVHALQESGLFLLIEPRVQVDKPIYIQHLYTEKEVFYPSYTQIFAGEGSFCDIWVEHKTTDGCFVNEFTDLVLENNAHVQYLDISFPKESSKAYKTLQASVKKESKLFVDAYISGACFYQQDFTVELLDTGAFAHTKGASFLQGKKHAHIDVLMQHKAPNTESDQHFKNVVQEGGDAFFTGLIFVEKDAQQIAAYQLNNNLLLDKNSVAHAEPNLKIFADDVKASHGATFANLSEKELFYLQTRGLSQSFAKKALVAGFLKHIIRNDIPKDLRQHIENSYGL